MNCDLDEIVLNKKEATGYDDDFRSKERQMWPDIAFLLMASEEGYNHCELLCEAGKAAWEWQKG